MYEYHVLPKNKIIFSNLNRGSYTQHFSVSEQKIFSISLNNNPKQSYITYHVRFIPPPPSILFIHMYFYIATNYFHLVLSSWNVVAYYSIYLPPYNDLHILSFLGTSKLRKYPHMHCTSIRACLYSTVRLYIIIFGGKYL